MILILCYNSFIFIFIFFFFLFHFYLILYSNFNFSYVDENINHLSYNIMKIYLFKHILFIFYFIFLYYFKHIISYFKKLKYKIINKLLKDLR